MENFTEWYALLSDIASSHGESVSDVDAWREDYDIGLLPEESFYSEYPEHKQ